MRESQPFWETVLEAIGGALIVGFLAFSLLLWAQGAFAQQSEIVGVPSVIDGDTLEIHGTRIRLSGIDAPEHDRHCGQVNVGQRAAHALDDLVQSRTVSCVAQGLDRYGRTVAMCSVCNADLARIMVTQGWARDWPRYSRGAYAGAERAARAAHRGAWGLQCPADLWGNRNYD